MNTHIASGQLARDGQFQTPLTGTRIHLLVIAIHVLLAIVIYGQTSTYGLVYIDDAEYIPENAMVRAGISWEGIKWAFSDFYMSNWHPLTWISHMIDVSLTGLNLGWHHLHNVILHTLNGLLVYLIILRLTSNWWSAFIFSLVFLAHPLHVESVAWLAERKDVLSAFFFLCGLILYDNYRAQPGLWRYIALAAAHSLGLLSKPMVVTFPLVLLILDVFVYHASPQGDFKLPSLRYLTQRVVEKIPLLLLSLALGITTVMAQHQGGAVVELAVIPFENRLLGAIVAYATYLKQFFAPIGLSVFYPLYTSAPPLSEMAASGFILLLLGAASIALLNRSSLFLAGYTWFLVMLLPVIGLLQVGGQSHADRYMYLPSVGLLLALSWLIPQRNHPRFDLVAIACGLFIAVFSIIAYWQVGNWENRHSLYTQALRVNGSNYVSHIALAQEYIDRGDWKSANEHAQLAIAMKPGQSFGHKALGDIALARGNPADAEIYFRQAASRGAPSAQTLNNLGIALAEQGKFDLAMTAFREALSIEPNLYYAKANIDLYTAKQKTSRDD